MDMLFMLFTIVTGVVISPVHCSFELCNDTIINNILSTTKAPNDVIRKFTRDSPLAYAFAPINSNYTLWYGQGGFITLSQENACSCGSCDKGTGREKYWKSTDDFCNCDNNTLPNPKTFTFVNKQSAQRGLIINTDELNLLYNILFLFASDIFCIYRCSLTEPGAYGTYGSALVPVNGGLSSAKIQQGVQKCKDKLEAAGLDLSNYVDLPLPCSYCS